MPFPYYAALFGLSSLIGVWGRAEYQVIGLDDEDFLQVSSIASAADTGSTVVNLFALCAFCFFCALSFFFCCS